MQNLGLSHVFKTVAEKLPDAGVECLLVGGFAVNYYGYTRNTLDVDFMIAADDIGVIRKIMIAAGFTNISMMDNVACFNMPDSNLRVDFLQVARSTMQSLLNNAKLITLLDCQMKIPALMDLLAMKLFALKHGWARRHYKDLPDIANLLVANNLDLDEDFKMLCLKFADTTILQKISDEVELLRS